MLTVMCGFPGSGKSTHLSKFDLSSKYWARTVILCPDDFRLALTGQQYYGTAEDMVWSHVKIAARVLLKREHHVIIDGTHLTPGSRKSWIKLAKGIGVDVDCRWQKVLPDVARKRNRARPGRQIVPELEMDRMIRSFRDPMVDEGFSDVYIVGSETCPHCGRVFDTEENFAPPNTVKCPCYGVAALSFGR